MQFRQDRKNSADTLGVRAQIFEMIGTTTEIYADSNLQLVRGSRCGDPERRLSCDLDREGEHALDAERFDVAEVEGSMGPRRGGQYCRGCRDSERRLDLHADSKCPCGPVEW